MIDAELEVVLLYYLIHIRIEVLHATVVIDNFDCVMER